MSRYFERAAELSGKTAVVTGASNGIGEGIARCLAADGAAVVINYASSGGEADRVVAEIKAKGGKAIAVQGDVTKAADVERIFAQTKQAFARLDILVNNATVYNLLPLNQVMEEDFHRYFNINVLGLQLATQEATKLFGPEGGSVFNINSVVSDLNPQNSVYYVATKSAAASVTRALANELSVKKIRVSTIDVIVQLLNRGMEAPPKGDAIAFVEDVLVEALSNGIRCWALRLESGTINILLRRPKT